MVNVSFPSKLLELFSGSQKVALEKRGLSPLTQRRLQQFRANARGFWSLWIFLALFIIAVGAPFVSNDKPIVVSFEGGLYFPTFINYPETTFGGDFETETEYRDPFVRDIVYVVVDPRIDLEAKMS